MRVDNLKNIDFAVRQINLLIDGVLNGQNTLGELLFELQNFSLAHGGLEKLASSTGLGKPSLEKTLSYNGNPHLSTFFEIINAFGFKIEVKKNNNNILPLMPKSALSFTHEELSRQWHPTKNKLFPSEVACGSHKRVFWVCPENNEHTWISSVINRSKGAGCPICSGKKVVESNSLLSTHAELVKKSWDFDKNLEWKPDEVAANSSKKLWWKCDKNHEWEASVRDRVLGKKCPFCSGLQK